jgi:uncharacterized protein YegL
VNLPHCAPCLLVLDVADTSSGWLNRGLKVLQGSAGHDPLAAARIQLAIVTTTGPRNKADLVTDWVRASRFEPPFIRSRGSSPLGHAMRLALHHVGKLRFVNSEDGTSFTRPWIVVISDGRQPENPSIRERVDEECRAAELARRCAIYPVAVDGENADDLQTLSATRVAALDTARADEFFCWLAECLRRLASTFPGTTVNLPSTSAWNGPGATPREVVGGDSRFVLTSGFQSAGTGGGPSRR